MRTISHDGTKQVTASQKATPKRGQRIIASDAYAAPTAAMAISVRVVRSMRRPKPTRQPSALRRDICLSEATAWHQRERYLGGRT